MKSKEYKEILEAYKNVYEQKVGVETKNPDETLQQMVDRQGLGGKVVKSGKLQKSHYEPSGDSINESHFKVGDEVICKKSGMEGEVIKLDKPDGAEDEKYYTVKREDGKTMKYAPNELKLAEKEGKEEEEKEEEDGKEEKEAKNGGASKKAETKFHTKLDKLVHKTFGSSPEEKKMKEELELDEARAMSHSGGTPHPLQGDGSRPRGMGGKTFGIQDLPPPAKRKDVKDVKEEVDIFDVILEHLVAEGYADTNQAALAIMANMSEEWKQDIVEAAKDQSNKQIEKGVKTTYKAGNVIDNQHQGRSRGLNRLSSTEREEKTKRMRGRLKSRRDDLFGERNRREDEARAELKKRLGL